jgi:hypothetical protein
MMIDTGKAVIDPVVMILKKLINKVKTLLNGTWK